jgi:hypothetical protein
MILAPWGGFGNHLRWLLLLSDQYNINFRDIHLSTADEKVEFIANEVYPVRRTWHNWMEFEWLFRDSLNATLKFTHDAMDVFDELKTVGCTIDPSLAYRSYSKFDTDFNGISQEQFLQMINKHNKFCGFAQQYYPTFIAVDSGKLYNETLDTEMYKRVTNFLGLEYKSIHAQEIHTLWYNRQVEAEHEYLEHKKNNPIPTVRKPVKPKNF